MADKNFVEHHALADALWNQQLYHKLQEEQNKRDGIRKL